VDPEQCLCFATKFFVAGRHFSQLIKDAAAKLAPDESKVVGYVGDRQHELRG
jgi:hypothetical protein